jgi:Cu/Ag efflux protein CusF
MTRRLKVLVAAALALSIGLTGYVSAQTSAPSPASGPVEGVAAATQLTIHGTIAAVDKSKKLVTIEANGRKVTLTVENPYNLKAAKVGEPVVVHYYEVVSVRKKKPGETIPAVSLNEGIATAKSGTPGAVAGERTSVLVTVEEVDQANGTVTLKGPDGSVEKVKARDPKNLQHLKAGDELVVTVSRLTAIAVDKESAG